MAAKKKTKKKAAKKKSPAKSKTARPKAKSGDVFAFCRAYIKKNRKATFAEVRDAAAKKGMTLYPISFGRAQALEGIVKSKPYGSRKKEAALKPKRGPGRPKGSKNKPKSVTAAATVDGLFEHLRTIERERDDALAVIAKIRSLVESI